jgi:hypothetical protein
MTIREKVAAALRKSDHADHFYEVSDEDYSTYADIAITAFLEAAAEPDEQTGVSWHMRPIYRAMLAAAPEFEWDK